LGVLPSDVNQTAIFNLLSMKEEEEEQSLQLALKVVMGIKC